MGCASCTTNTVSETMTSLRTFVGHLIPASNQVLSTRHPMSLRRASRNLVPAGVARLAVCVLCALAGCEGSRAGSRSNLPAESDTGHVASNALIPAAPGCERQANLCVRDTAFRHDSGDPTPTVGVNWLVFAAEGDSLELDVSAEGGNVVRLTTTLGHENDALGNTASSMHLRMSRDGIVVVQISMDQIWPDSVPYVFRMRQIPSRGASTLRATGEVARLRVSSQDQYQKLSFAPASSFRTGAKESAWEIFPETYKVALVADSLYSLCSLPCAKPDRVHLRAGSSVEKKY